MKNTFLTLAVLICLTITSLYAKQNSFDFSPQKPKAGDIVKVTYNPENTKLSDAENVELRYYIFSEKSDKNFAVESAHHKELIKKNGVFEAEIKISDNDDLVYAYFINDAVTDYNDGKGYVIKIYDNNGSEKNGVKLAYALLNTGLGNYYYGFKQDEKVGYQLFTEIFKSKPESKLKYFRAYTGTLSKVDGGKEILLKELNKISSKEDLDENILNEIFHGYRYLEMPERAEEVKERLLKKYPLSGTALWTKYEAIRSNPDLEEKLKLTEALYKEFPKDVWGDFRPFRRILREFEKNDRIDLFEKALNNNPYLWEHGLVLNNIVRLLENRSDKKSVDFLDKASKLQVEFCKEDLLSPKSELYSHRTQSETDERKKRILGYALVARAKYFSMLNKNKRALDLYNEAITNNPLSNWHSLHLEPYTECLIANHQYDKAQEVIENEIKKGGENFTEKLQEYHKQVYKQTNDSIIGYNEHLAKLKDKGKSSSYTKIKESMIKEKAPKFSLKDMDSNIVSSTDLKGKVVILDFWATWCKPCIASFPAMQKAVDKFKDDDEVEFLFINCQERSDDKFKLVADFMKDKDFTFRILVDEDNKVTNSFNVTGIPAKLFIDKEGFIRFNKVGFGGVDEVAVEEISTMISLLK